MFINKEHIPDNIELVFVADFFANDILGGAELTHDAILQACPYKLVKIHSRALTVEMVESHKDKKWLLGNVSQVPKDVLVTIANVTNYSMIECDYLYCQFRSSHLHKLKTGNECDCHKQTVGRFVNGLHKRAKSVHFMSKGQLNEYKRLFPKMNNWNHLFVQGSTFDSKTLNILKVLRDRTNKKDTRWVVLQGGSWIKNQQQTELYCQHENISYILLGGLKPEDFLNELAKYKGLVFHPSGMDTAPRLVLEAKLLNLELDLNENVQNKNDFYMQMSPEKLEEYLKTLPGKFWKEVKL